MIEIKEFKVIFVDEKPLIVDENGLVVVTVSQIGLVFNEGPPHDHNRPWMYKGVVGYLEDLRFDLFVEGMESTDGEVFLVVDNGVPVLYDGMVVMDLYSDLDKLFKKQGMEKKGMKKQVSENGVTWSLLSEASVLIWIGCLRFINKTECMRRLSLSQIRASILIRLLGMFCLSSPMGISRLLGWLDSLVCRLPISSIIGKVLIGLFRIRSLPRSCILLVVLVKRVKSLNAHIVHC
jgi:hypothetical protein